MEKLETMAQNLEKQEKIRKELEGDLSLMSEKLSVLKAENSNLNAKIRRFSKKLFKLYKNSRTYKQNPDRRAEIEQSFCREKKFNRRKRGYKRQNPGKNK